MNKSNILYIIILISLALLGMTVIQFNWMREAIQMREARFNETTQKVLNNITVKLEQHEAKSIALNHFKKIDTDNGFGLMIDKDQFNSALASNYYGISSECDPIINVNERVIITEDSRGIHEEIIERITVDFEHCIDPSELLFKDKYQQLRSQIGHKTKLFEQMATDFIFSLNPVEKRVHPALIDSLIKQELTMHGIHTDYEYQLRPAIGQQAIFRTANYQPASNRGSLYRAILYPNDPFNRGIELSLHFPERSKYILSNMWVMFSSSLLFILVIIACFILTILTILRQKQLSEMKTDFINNMTHELKTPISSISLASEMIKAQGTEISTDALAKYSNIIFDENKRLGKQVDRVLQMALIDKGKFNFKIQDLDLNEIISGIQDQYKLKVKQAGGSVNIDLAASDPVINGDLVHVTNIINNLLDNAIKYSKEIPNISIHTRDAENGVIIGIEDNGIGMTKEAQSRIFDKFYRVSTGDLHDVKGFGLGLSYVKSVVDALNGTVNVVSELNKGSLFEIYLPKIQET